MSLVYESMPIPSLSSPVSNLSLSSTPGLVPSVTSSAPAPVSSASNSSMVTLATATVTASSSSSSGNYSNDSSVSDAPTTGGKTSTVSSSKPATGMIVSTVDFTSGQSVPTSLILAPTNSTGQGAVPTSTYTSWDAVDGSGNGSSSVVGVGGTGLASPQDRPSRAARGPIRTKSSPLALGVLVLVLVLIA